MFGFIKKCFFIEMTFFGCSVLRVNPLKYVSIDNQESKIRTKIIDIDKNDLCFILTVLK